MTVACPSEEYLMAKAIPAVHVAFSGETSLRLQREAETRGVTPQLLALSLLHTILTQDMTDSVLDGDTPESLAPGHGRAKNGLTRLRCALLYLLALHAGADGVCRISANGLAVLIKASSSGSVSSALMAMERRGLVKRVGFKRSSFGWRLTDEGHSVARDLGDLGYSPKGGEA